MDNLVPAIIIGSVVGVFVVAAGVIAGFLAGRARE